MATIEPINRVAFELGPISVYWYGVIIGVGVFLGYMLANQQAKQGV